MEQIYKFTHCTKTTSPYFKTRIWRFRRTVWYVSRLFNLGLIFSLLDSYFFIVPDFTWSSLGTFEWVRMWEPHTAFGPNCRTKVQSQNRPGQEATRLGLWVVLIPGGGAVEKHGAKSRCHGSGEQPKSRWFIFNTLPHFPAQLMLCFR